MSRVTIRIPTPLRSFVDGADEIPVEGNNVREALLELVRQHGDLDRQLFNSDGDLREFVNVFLDDRNIRSLQGLDSPLERVGVLHIVPAVAGGRS